MPCPAPNLLSGLTSTHTSLIKLVSISLYKSHDTGFKHTLRLQPYSKSQIMFIVKENKAIKGLKMVVSFCPTGAPEGVCSNCDSLQQ